LIVNIDTLAPAAAYTVLTSACCLVFTAVPASTQQQWDGVNLPSSCWGTWEVSGRTTSTRWATSL